MNRARRRLAALPPSLAAAVPPLGLIAVWTASGGYGPETLGWGALVMLACTAALLIGRPAVARPPRAVAWPLGLFAAYTAFSYLSIAWAGSPDQALLGSNRTLLFLLVFGTAALVPWSPATASAALLVAVGAIAAVEVVALVRMATGDDVSGLMLDGRLAYPTTYYNASAALYTVGALVATSLATRRELPAPLRGALLASATAGLDLALACQSRGWLFTLPIILLAGLVITRDRLATVVPAGIVAVGTLAGARPALHLFGRTPGPSLDGAARAAAHVGILACAGVFAAGTLLALIDRVRPLPSPSPPVRRRLGAGAAALAVLVATAGATAATHGHPIAFARTQWNGFSHPATATSDTSHFSAVGSGRYDFWRVGIEAFGSAPVGGLGQDNFANYYVTRRRTDEEPAYTHSWEMRLLVHTGLVGFLLFIGFLVTAVRTARRAMTATGALGRTVAASCLLPAVVWLGHGSLDWFWEMPSLSGAALLGLGIAVSLGARSPIAAPAPPALPHLGRRTRVIAAAAGAGVLVAATAAVGFPYLAERAIASGLDERLADPGAALATFRTAGRLDPLDPAPARFAGALALAMGDDTLARSRFGDAISRDPGGWFAWLGRGLAESELGDRRAALASFRQAYAINPRSTVVRRTLMAAAAGRPLTAKAALRLITLSQ